MATKCHVITEKHFAIFKHEALRLIRLWAIDDWKVSLVHERLKECYAQCRTDAVSRVCTLSLSTTGVEMDGNGDKHYAPTDFSIRETARHEVIHLLLADLDDVGRRRYATKDEVERASESVARKLHELLPR